MVWGAVVLPLKRVLQKQNNFDKKVWMVFRALKERNLASFKVGLL